MIDTLPLQRFKRRVETYQKRWLNEAQIQVLRALSLQLTALVRETYPKAIVTVLSTDREAGTAKAIIDIRDEDLWYKEFGTGYKGMGTYEWSYYPTMELTFFSRGATQHTSGWEYAYHPETQRLGGWWFTNPTTGKSEFTKGQVSQGGVGRALVTIKTQGIPNLAEFVRTNMR